MGLNYGDESRNRKGFKKQFVGKIDMTVHFTPLLQTSNDLF